MNDEIRLKEDYTLARCCSPSSKDKIIGYYSHNNIIKVHKENCPNLKKAEPERLVSLKWSDILAPTEFQPGSDYHDLDKTDFSILQHHLDYGIDYSLLVAKALSLPKQDVFERHKKLKDFGLIERVEPRMVQYRKGIVANKWIKHRNHTYYQLTDTGKKYLSFHNNQQA